ncbi:hypothetical protein ACI3PL_25030, partial [Lacticaseibacillus paracasei]
AVHSRAVSPRWRCGRVMPFFAVGMALKESPLEESPRIGAQWIPSHYFCPVMPAGPVGAVDAR